MKLTSHSSRGYSVFLYLFFPFQSGKKVGSIPNPFVHFTVGQKTYDSKVIQQAIFPILYKQHTAMPCE